MQSVALQLNEVVVKLLSPLLASLSTEAQESETKVAIKNSISFKVVDNLLYSTLPILECSATEPDLWLVHRESRAPIAPPRSGTSALRS